MKTKLIILLSFLLIGIVMISGCTSSEQINRNYICNNHASNLYPGNNYVFCSSIEIENGLFCSCDVTTSPYNGSVKVYPEFRVDIK